MEESVFHTHRTYVSTSDAQNSVSEPEGESITALSNDNKIQKKIKPQMF